jgi:hypothetical protein
MAPEELLTVLRERPFRPFRIALTNGQTLEVHHPEMVLPGKRTAVVGIPASGESQPLYDHRITLDLLHIVSLEPLKIPAPSDGPYGSGQQ